jgi:DNA-binding response OmpR family regulator
MLIVEDDSNIASVVERAGATLNFAIERSTDGWDAIGKLEETSYDVIVVDLDVPQASGFGVVTYLREEYGQGLDNVILMTEREKRAVEEKYPSATCRIVRRSDSMERWTDLLGMVTTRE